MSMAEAFFVVSAIFIFVSGMQTKISEIVSPGKAHKKG